MGILNDQYKMINTIGCRQSSQENRYKYETLGYKLHYSKRWHPMYHAAAAASGDRFLVALRDAITPQVSFYQPSPNGKVKIPTVTVEA